MWGPIKRFWIYSQSESDKLLLWAKSGSSAWTAVPIVFWTIGSIVIAYRLVSAVFKRFLFRRVPLWEQILQQLLFIWLVVYSLYFWKLLVHIVKLGVDQYGQSVLEKENAGTEDFSKGNQDWITQVILACVGMLPLLVYSITRPHDEDPPLMIWITANPWLRREMGPNGYYLNRPPSTDLENEATNSQLPSVFKTLSDSKVYHKETVKKRRYSKSC